MLMPGGDKTDAFGAVPPAPGDKALTFGTPTIAIVFGIIDACLIKIDPLVGLELC